MIVEKVKAYVEMILLHIFEKPFSLPPLGDLGRVGSSV
jgi:hypothetical protein